MPDTLPDIEVVGQRRRPNGTFPQRGGGSGGGGLGGEGGEHQNEVGENDPPPDQIDPCASPDTALDWNADAAAAEGKKEFERRGREEDGDDGHLSRERYAFILQREDGSLYLSSIATGGPNWVNPNEVSGQVTPFNVVGMVHNHPGGSQAPSGDDWAGFDIYYNYVLQHAGLERANQLRIYIIARDTNSTSPALQIKAYNNQSSRDSDAEGDEVNPEALPCPGPL